MIENAMVAGFCASGMDVFLLGPIPTPAVAMLVRSCGPISCVMISAAHNPYFDNANQTVSGPDGYKAFRTRSSATRIGGVHRWRSRYQAG